MSQPIDALEQSPVALEVNTIAPSIESDGRGVHPCVPHGATVAGSPSTGGPAPRDPGAPGLGEEISHVHAQGHSPAADALLEAPRRCRCGCGALAPTAKKSDRRSGARAGRPLRFVKGHAARLRAKLTFADLTENWFLDHVDTSGRHWFAAVVEPTVEGHRIHMARIGVLLHQRQAVTLGALANLRLERRCRRGCARPDHQILRMGHESENTRRAAAIEAVRAKMQALRAARAS